MERSEGSLKDLPTRYWVNLGFFIVLVSGLVLFLHWHFLPFFAASTLIVSSFGFVALFELVWKLVTKGVPAKSITVSSLLSHPLSREYLVLLLFALLLLYCVVSSIYLVYEGASRGEEVFEVEVLAGGNPYIPPEQVTSWDRVRGRPFIQWPLKRTCIELVIVKPRGYASLRRDFGPWRPAHIRVPADFDKKQVHALRMFPGAGLYHRLPKEGEEALFPYDLEIILDDTMYSIGNLRGGAVIVGADSLDLRWLLEDEDEASRRRVVVNYLAAQGADPELRNEVFRVLDSSVLLKSTREFVAGEAVTLRIRQHGGTVADTTISAPVKHGVRTFFLTAGDADD